MEQQYQYRGVVSYSDHTGKDKKVRKTSVVTYTYSACWKMAYVQALYSRSSYSKFEIEDYMWVLDLPNDFDTACKELRTGLNLTISFSLVLWIPQRNWIQIKTIAGLKVLQPYDKQKLLETIE